jgi:MFS family permease
VTAAVLAVHRRTFASLRTSRNFRLFTAGQALSQPGTWMERVAQAWLVLSLTHSPVAVGVLSAAQFAPFLLFGLFGGVVTDRIDARKAVVWTQALSMVVAAAMAGVAFGGVATPVVIYALAFVRGLVLVLDGPSRQSLTYEMVGRDDLANAVALNSSLFNASRIVGPGIGGLLSASVGFAVNTASYAAVLVGLALMRRDELRPVGRRASSHRVLADLREGLAYARGTVEVRATLTMLLVIALLGINFGVLLPVLAKRTLHSGPGTFGLISASFGVGALIGALFSASLKTGATRRTMLVGAGGFSLGELALAPLHSTAAVAALLVGVGIFYSVYTSQTNALLQLSAPDHMRGRIVSLFYTAFNGTGPLGGILVGVMCAAGGTELAFGVAGAVGVAMTLVAWAMLQERKDASERLTVLR